VLNTSEVLPIGTIVLMASGKLVRMVYPAPMAVLSWGPSMYAIIEQGSWRRWLRSPACAQVASGFVALELVCLFVYSLSACNLRVMALVQKG
jgi:hypothetical protein